jgi:hypothetical protein
LSYKREKVYILFTFNHQNCRSFHQTHSDIDLTNEPQWSQNVGLAYVCAAKLCFVRVSFWWIKKSFSTFFYVKKKSKSMRKAQMLSDFLTEQKNSIKTKNVEIPLEGTNKFLRIWKEFQVSNYMEAEWRMYSIKISGKGHISFSSFLFRVSL